MANKVIEVGFKRKVQPVKIGGIDFEIALGEKQRIKYLEALPAFLESFEAHQKTVAKAAKEQDFEAVIKSTEAVKESSRELIDLLLGAGAFEKLYQAADEDLEVVLEAFLEVSEKYRALQTKQKAQAYIDGKKK